MNNQKSECVFCKIAKGEIPVKRIYENDNFFSMPDAHPVVPGHCLVIPKKHFETILDLPSTLGIELNDCIKQTALDSMKSTKSDGFNIVVNTFESAGQVVKHAHFHIIPRKKSDGFKTLVK